MKKIKKDIQSWIIIGITFLTTVLIGGTLYAAIGSTWTAPSTLEVGAGSGLTASSWNKLLGDFNNLDARSIPTGALMAFNGNSCPSGWDLADGTNDPAVWGGVNPMDLRGKFLRGIDPSGSTVNDPSGTRVPGNQQTDSLQDHTHYMVGESGWGDNIVAFQDTNTDSTYGPTAGASRGDVYIYVGYGKVGRFSTETRPKNAAVLYCIKL